MGIDTQADVVSFLRKPSTHGLRTPVDVYRTHISLVFAAGDRAYKLKRAVRLPYADFSTLELRVAACRRELELNRKTAPELYLGVRRITRERDGTLALDGEGEAVDAVVEMRRFDQDCLFDRMAGRGQLSVALMEELSREIAAFHAGAAVAHGGTGEENMAGVLDINEAGFATSDLFTTRELVPFHARFRSALAGHAALLDARERAGRVRRCHGDLHLRNICLFEDRPTIFDCIDFSEQIATVDVLYDLAFLLMDLRHRGLGRLANLVANRYLDASGEVEGFSLLPFFMAVRSAVRAHVTATSASSQEDGRKELAEEALKYFELAGALLSVPEPRLIVIGGLSGSGKTTIAEAAAWRIGGGAGARVLESDRIRKSMFGVAPDTRLPAEAYRPQVSESVYRKIAEEAGRIVAAGGTAIANAVFDSPEHRRLVEEAAGSAGVEPTTIWLSVDAETLMRRVVRRSGGQSDATADILTAQLKRVHAPAGWLHVDSGGSVEETVAAVLAAARGSQGGP